MKVNQFDPYLGKEEIASVKETFERNWITEGPKTDEFQKKLQDFCRLISSSVYPNSKARS
jgi:Predicted pyridoxal phosphate-dependent enzyme apparently involved in regulation of cell wall biogenesis